MALAAGPAVELVHCASLIVDDLPCMGDAALRRVRPTVNRAHGEASAILAAIALMNLACEQIAKAPLGDENLRAEAMRVLTHAVGTAGLVAGQDLDLHAKAQAQGLEEPDEINWMKTGVLFVAAADLGVIAGGASDGEIVQVRAFARRLGLAFQMHSLWIGGFIAFGCDQQVCYGWVAVFAVSQGVPVWILTTLGRRWTTRIIVSPEPLVAGGPFEYLRHPN